MQSLLLEMTIQSMFEPASELQKAKHKINNHVNELVHNASEDFCNGYDHYQQPIYTFETLESKQVRDIYTEFLKDIKFEFAEDKIRLIAPREEAALILSKRRKWVSDIIENEFSKNIQYVEKDMPSFFNNKQQIERYFDRAGQKVKVTSSMWQTLVYPASANQQRISIRKFL